MRHSASALFRQDQRDAEGQIRTGWLGAATALRAHRPEFPDAARPPCHSDCRGGLHCGRRACCFRRRPGPRGKRSASLTGLASADAGRPGTGDSPKAGGSGRGAAAPIPVTVAIAEKAPFPIIVRTFGTVQSPAVVVVGARISSQVTSIHVKDGQMVKAGDLLISLDDRVVLAALARDKAVLAKDNALLVSVTADLSRAKDLVDKGAGTQQAYDTALAAQQSAQATVDSDQATVDADQLQLDFTKITAPIDGRLGAVQVVGRRSGRRRLVQRLGQHTDCRPRHGHARSTRSR